MVDGVLFIGTVIVAVTEVIKYYVPKVGGPVTIAVAALLGALVAVVDTHIGVVDLNIATGIMTGLSASGIVAIAKKI